MIQIDVEDSTATYQIGFNTNVADSDGNLWYVTDWAGWELPEPRQQWLNSIGDHGAIPAESYFNKRDMTLTGVCKVADYWKAWYKLVNVFGSDIIGDVNYGKLSVHEGSTVRYVFFKIFGRPKVQPSGPLFAFQISITCPDPHKYDAASSDPPGVGTNLGVF